MKSSVIYRDNLLGIQMKHLSERSCCCANKKVKLSVASIYKRSASEFIVVLNLFFITRNTLGEQSAFMEQNNKRLTKLDKFRVSVLYRLQRGNIYELFMDPRSFPRERELARFVHIGTSEHVRAAKITYRKWIDLFERRTISKFTYKLSRHFFLHLNVIKT